MNHPTLHPVAWFLGYDEYTRDGHEPDLSSEDTEAITKLVEADNVQGYLEYCHEHGITGMNEGITENCTAEDIYQDLRQLMTTKLEWS